MVPLEMSPTPEFLEHLILPSVLQYSDYRKPCCIGMYIHIIFLLPVFGKWGARVLCLGVLSKPNILPGSHCSVEMFAGGRDRGGRTLAFGLPA